MVKNPYGAVPAALKETRLTLRDIASDMLGTRAEQNRLSLEQSKAKSELAMIAANLDRDRLIDQRQTEQFNKTFTLQQAAEERRAQEAKRQDEQFNKTYSLRQAAEEREAEQFNKTFSLQQAAEERRAREEARQNEVKTAGEWIKEAGWPPAMVDVFGIESDTKVARRDATLTYTTLATALQKNPGLAMLVYGFKLRGTLLDMQDKMNNPDLTPQQQTSLRQEYDVVLQKFNNLDQLIMAAKEPDQTKIVESARRVWSENPDMAAQYKNFDGFLTAFQSDIKNARGVFHDEIKRLRSFQPALSEEQISSNKKKIIDGLEKLQSIKPANLNMNIIKERIADAIKAKDTESALRILNRALNVATPTPQSTQRSQNNRTDIIDYNLPFAP